VELRVNGNSQGTVRSQDHIFLWDNVALAAGENRIEGIGTKFGKTFTDTCTWEYKARDK
jgi:beta-galactosidase